MSKRQEQPGTTSPQERINKKIKNRLDKVGNKDKKPNTKPHSGSKADKRRSKDPKYAVRSMQRRPGAKKKISTEGVNVSDIIMATRYLIENHGMNVGSVISGFGDGQLLSRVAKKCMITCLSGWTDNDKLLVSENTDLVLSKDSWEICEDGTAQLKNGFRFDYDWLYELSNTNSDGAITEGIESEPEIDTDSFSDTLSNASALLRKLSEKEVKKYILNAAKGEDGIDIMNLKKVLEDTGVNYKFVGSEVDGDRINLIIRVKYSADGTQEGVIEKRLSIEVKPSADVTQTDGEPVDDDELDLGFGGSNESESESESEPLDGSVEI